MYGYLDSQPPCVHIARDELQARVVVFIRILAFMWLCGCPRAEEAVDFSASPVKLVCFDDVSVTVLSIIHIDAGHWGVGALVPLKQYMSPMTSKITQLKSSSTLYCETWITRTVGDHQTKFEL